ncbi:MAG TPA: hypothetical protein VNX47_06280 [Nevskia sp.]|jgi:hypothetical protein|nr:hypothetical protein [Nevskia sp.]
MSNISEKPNPPDDPWNSVTWEGSERLQLRRERALSLREKILAMEGMAEMTMRMAQLRSGSNQQR